MADVFELLRDYRVKVVVGWSYVVALSTVLLETVFRTYASSLLRLVTVEEYSYIVVGLAVSMGVVHLSIRNLGMVYGVRIGKVLTSISLLLLSLLFLVLARIEQERVVQLEGLSFVLLLIALLSLVYDARRLRDALPLLSFFLLIPVPGSLIDSITPVLSRYVGRIAAYLTGARFIEQPGYSAIEVATPSGIQQFSVETTCTGIVTLGSILSIVPLLLYVISFSVAKTSRKVIAVLVSLTLSLLIGLTGNLLRVVLVIVASRYYGVEIGLGYFHYSPSIVYSLLSIIAAIKVIDRILKLRSLLPDIPPRKIYFSFSSVGALLVIMGLATILYYIFSISIVAPAVGTTEILRLKASTLELLENPGIYILRNTTLLSSVRDPRLTQALGALTVHRISFYFNETFFRGYIEVVDTLARLHTWQLCLTLQGYEVVGAWSELVGNRRIYYILVSRDGSKYLLAYTIAPVSTADTLANTAIYTRVSIFTPAGEGLGYTAEVSKRVLLNMIAFTESPTVANYIPLLTTLSTSILIFTSLSFITPFSGFLYRVFLNSLKRFIGRGGGS